MPRKVLQGVGEVVQLPVFHMLEEFTQAAENNVQTLTEVLQLHESIQRVF